VFVFGSRLKRCGSGSVVVSFVKRMFLITQPNVAASLTQMQDLGLLRDAGVNFEPSIYTAVLVAAFGGVKIELSPGRRAKVHPFLILLSCLPVTSIQLSAIIALRSDMALEQPFHDNGASDRGSQLLTLKTVMIVVVFVVTFKTLLSSVQLVLFLLNPITGLEAKLPTLEQWVGPRNVQNPLICCSFSWVSMALWSLIALMLNVFFTYSVCGDSMSVILEARTTTDVIYNSLAITFIADLGRIWWEFLASVLHMSPITDFRFKLMNTNEVWLRGGELTPQIQQSLICPELTNFIITWTHWGCVARICNANRTFLSRGAGARRMETSTSMVLMYIAYKRQLLMLLLAIDTNVLPAARVACAYWRVHFGIGAQNMLQYLPTLGLQLVEKLYIISVSDQLKVATEEKLRGHCGDPKYAGVDGQHGIIESKYRHVTLTFSVIMVVWLIGPSLWWVAHRCLFDAGHLSNAINSIDDEQEQEIDDLEDATERHGRRLDQLELGLMQVQRNLQLR